MTDQPMSLGVPKVVQENADDFKGVSVGYISPAKAGANYPRWDTGNAMDAT